jgi:carnitine 3-dehydrogenase
MELKGHSRIKRFAQIGGGAIGMGWTIRGLANGLDVTIADPAPGIEKRIRAEVEARWPIMERQGLKPGASPDRMKVVSSIAEAVADADFIQENVPENLDLKVRVFKEISDHAAPDVIIASSTSGLLPSKIQGMTKGPERVIVAHPFTPLYILPLVEIAGGEKTSEEAKKKAAGFYASIGMRPLEVRKEVDGFISDRLQVAMWHEALHLVKEGVATIAEIDAAVNGGPGLRWAVTGLAMTWHISGDRGLQGSMRGINTDDLNYSKLKPPRFTDDFIDEVHGQAVDAMGGRSASDMQRRRDETLLKVIEVIRENWYPQGQDGWPEMQQLD